MKNLDIATTLNSAITRLGRRIRHIDDLQDIGRARLSALSVLVFGGPRTISELAADEMVSVATMHHVVKGLESLQLADRKASNVDRRATIINATRKGRRFMERARQGRLDFYNEKLEQLSNKEREAVAQFAHLALGWLER